MTKSAYKRSLAAIVFTDIVGYSSVMQKDENQAKVLRDRHRQIFDELTPLHNGKILQYYGDGTLSVFDSAVDAVECATKMQLAFQENPQVPLKVGIHLGDITFDDQEAFGDGMNIASRIERICSPRSIFISYKVHDEIKNHSWLKSKHLGSFKFKNIQSDIDLYAISNEGLNVPDDHYLANLDFNQNKASRHKSISMLTQLSRMAAGILAIIALVIGANYAYHRILPHDEVADVNDGKLSLAVLPFTNLMDDEESDYFSDGITEDILTLLSQIEGLDVVSRTSVMQYKNTEKSIPRIGRELGANHILEGSVRKSGNKVRISAQLIDAKSDSHVWADTYDKEFELTEIFDVQTEVAENIATALKSQLTVTDMEMLAIKPTDDVMAYDHYLKGRDHYRKYNMEDNELAISCFNDALKIDEDFALAYAGLGDAFAQKAFKMGVDGELIDSAISVSNKAIELKPGLSEGYKSLGLSYQYLGKYDKALDAYMTAMKYDRKNDMAATNISSIYLMEGDFVKAFDWSYRALDINPAYHHSILALATKYFILNMDNEAKSLCQNGLEVHPDYTGFYYLLGNIALRDQEYELAHAEADKILSIEANNIQALRLHADAYFLNGEFSQAKEAYKSVLAQIEKGDDEHFMTNRLARGALAHIAISEGHKESGEKELRGIIDEVESMKETFNKERYYDRMMSFFYAALSDKPKTIEAIKNIADNDILDIKFLKANHLFKDILDTPEVRKIIDKEQKDQDSIRAELLRVRDISVI